MKILISAFACEPNRGSEQEVGWRWALELSRRMDVTVLTQSRNRPGIEKWCSGNGGLPSSLRFEYLQLPDPIYRLKSRIDALTWPYYAVWQLFAARRAAELHGVRNFDLIHHLTFASFRVPIWMKTVGPPVVIGPVGGAEMAPWKLLGYRSSPLAWVKESVRNLMTYPSTLMLGLFPPVHPNRGICLAATPGMEKIFSAKGIRSMIFPTIGVDSEKVGMSRKHGEGGCRFLYVGRLHVLKGIQFLLDAFDLAKIPDSSLTIVGSGPAELRLRRQVRRLGFAADKVTWVGAMPRADLDRVYSDHDVLVAPSMYESGGMVVLEAMHHSLPCIVLDAGGHSVSVSEDCGMKIDSRVTGVEVVRRLAAAMIRYASDPILRRQHGEAAAARVAQEYQWDTKVARMQKIYEDVLRQGAGARTMEP